MRTIPFAAVMVLACNTPQPTQSSDAPVSVGSAAEELRGLGQRDRDDVEQCRAFAARCSADLDSGSSRRCARIEQHCDALEEQLEEDRAEIEECLEEAAQCEQNASDPADCEEARGACAPADRQFRTRRDRTRQCASRAEQCLDPDNRFDRPREVDAGVQACDPDAIDFVGCCRGKHGADGDAGVERTESRFGRAPRDGFQPRRDVGPSGNDDPDAGVPPPRRRF
jgi:hypothetical protein